MGFQVCCGAQRHFEGRLDEVRFLSVDLSEDWITTEYNNQYDPSSFYSLTAEMTATTLCSTLPIELVDFKGRTNELNEVVLNWTTASETNNAWFDIEHSTDGLSFKSIQRLPGAGHSSELIDYEYIDKNPEQGVNYYRLKQTDYDGTYADSEVIRVVVTRPVNRLKVYPNPSQGQIYVEGLFAPGGSLVLYDMDGRQRYRQTLPQSTAVQTLTIQGLAPGVYRLCVDMPGGPVTKKAIVY